MIKPTIPQNEKERLESLKSFNILDTLPEKDYDNLTFIASVICDTPISVVSLIDTNRQWFKSRHGLDATETPRDLAFCAHAINKPKELLVVPDSRQDARFHDNPLVTDAPNVVFYAGAPLTTKDGNTLGTLCVIDSKPKEITENQKKALIALADQVMALLELRKNISELDEKNKLVTSLNNELDAFSYRLSHDLKSPVRGISNLSEWILDDEAGKISEESVKNLKLIGERSEYMSHLISTMLEFTKVRNEKFEFEKFNVKNLVESILHSCSGDYLYEINFDNCDNDIHHVEIALSICFQNLITNSLKFNDKKLCKLEVSIKDTDNLYEITYLDNGPGIPAEYQYKIFEIFETLGEKSENSSGIGLSTIVAVLNRLNGSISLVTGKNKRNEIGAEFLIILPKK